jgi:hypothetical protein
MTERDKQVGGGYFWILSVSSLPSDLDGASVEKEVANLRVVSLEEGEGAVLLD